MCWADGPAGETPWCLGTIKWSGQEWEVVASKRVTKTFPTLEEAKLWVETIARLEGYE